MACDAEASDFAARVAVILGELVDGPRAKLEWAVVAHALGRSLRATLIAAGELQQRGHLEVIKRSRTGARVRLVLRDE